jgi:hypothetical protein
MDKESLYRNLNEGIITERMPAFRRNLEKNRGLIDSCGGLGRVLPEFRGKDVCIAGAGPSLDGCIGELKKYHNRRELAVIAVDMALLPLVRSGIRPGYVISCETLPVDFFGGVDTRGMGLLAFTCMSPVNLRRWRGDISFFNWMISGPAFDELWDRAGRHLGSIATGNIVTTQAVAFALGCGARSLLLAGNDLAFGRRYYTRGTAVHAAELNRADRFTPGEKTEFDAMRRRRDYELHRGGRSFYTSRQFLAAKTWLEELVSRHSVPVYDCSDPGLSEKHVKKTGIRDYFSRFDRRPARGR